MMTSAEKMFLDLQQEITQRNLLPGDRLKSENELCASYHISRPTVRKILAQLARIDLIEKRPGVGTFVKGKTSIPQPTTPPEFRIGIDFMVNSGFGNFYFGTIIQGITAAEAGQNCLFCPLDIKMLAASGGSGQALDAVLLARSTDYSREELELIAGLGVPVILINDYSVRADFAYLTVDNRREAARAVRSMLQQGQSEIALIGGDTSSTQERAAGWRDAYQELHLAVPEHLHISTTDLLNHPRRVAEFIRSQKFSGAFLVNALALAQFYSVYSTCQERANRNLNLMCFDDLDLLPEFRGLACSFVRMPIREMGAVAIDYLRRKKQNFYQPVLRKLFHCDLVLRDFAGSEDIGSPEGKI